MIEQILAVFQEHPQQFISGEQLSEQLGCSRTAVWKHIQSLRQQGYEFEAVSRKGYRLVRAPDLLNVQRLQSKLATAKFGRKMSYELKLVSTQNRAREWVAKGAEEGKVIIAEQQTGGKGTRGKSWFSPPGKGVWLSIILKPGIPLQFISQLTLLFSVALCRTFKQMLNVDVGIKWPNDLLIDGRKVSGILLESVGEDERIHYVIAGVGISANLLLEDFPESLRGKVTSLRIASGQVIDREHLICAFLLELEKLYDLYLEKGFAPIRTLWEALSITLDRPLKVQSAEGKLEAIAEGVDDMGALIVKLSDGRKEKIYSGDRVQL